MQVMSFGCLSSIVGKMLVVGKKTRSSKSTRQGSSGASFFSPPI